MTTLNLVIVVTRKVVQLFNNGYWVSGCGV